MNEPRVNFFDLPPEDRAAAYDRATDNGEKGDFFDLPAEDRARAYEAAEDRYEGDYR